jgi:hypothetical protein
MQRKNARRLGEYSAPAPSTPICAAPSEREAQLSN